MTERRDPIPFSSSSRLDADGERRGDPPSRAVGSRRSGRRLSLAVVAGLVLVAAGWLVLKVAGTATAWLHRQPRFSASFDKIALDPPPPDAYRGGPSGILSRVRDRAGLGDSIRVLDQDLGELGLAFAKHSPWVARVVRVERAFPDRITVRLEYREPIARLDLGTKDFYAIGGDGAVLPGEDVRPSVAATLVRIEGLKGPVNARPGLFLGADETGAIAPETAAAVALARWLHGRDAKSDPLIASISLAQGPGKMLLKTRRGVWVHWGSAPGDEAPDEPRAAEKFERLKGLARFLDDRDSPSGPRIAVVSVSLGGDALMLKTRRGLWVLWKHGVGEETGEEPKAAEKLERLIRWEDAHPGPAANPAAYLEFTRDGVRLRSGSD